MQGKSRKNRGYVLIEAIVAITIAVVGLLGIFSLLSRSLSLNRVVADRFVASYLAAEGIEIVKNLIDNNILKGVPWNEGLSSGTYEADYADTGLIPDTGRFINVNPDTGAYGYAELTPTLMKRTIAIRNSADGEEIAVGSRVNWVTRGGGKFDINLEEHLFHWR
jgi:type II secretory pathway pseudopilin PulG